MTLTRVVVAFFFATACDHALAVRTGTDLLRECQSEISASYCLGYINGFVSHYMITEKNRVIRDAAQPESPTWLRELDRRFCLPEHSALDQMRLVYIKYVKDNPERLSDFASDMLLDSLVDAFPCPPER